jgi:hypothetical protein
MTNLHESRLTVLSGEDKLTLYQWNTKIARHYFCSICGIYPFHRKRSISPQTLDAGSLRRQRALPRKPRHRRYPRPRSGGERHVAR